MNSEKVRSKMKIAITGAGGFLGTELLRQLAQRKDVTVYAFTFDFERQRDTYIISDNIITLDNSEAEKFDFSNTDVLINCAFPRNVSDDTFAKGLNFLQSVIEKAVSDNVGAVINISSQSVYSQLRKEPADEFSPIILESKYAVGKYWSELFVNSMCRNIRHTNLRMASLIGVGFDQRIVNRFAIKVKNGEQITITGGDQIFGFLDVRDAAAGIIAAAMSDRSWDEAYDLGTNESYTLKEMAEKAIEIGKNYGFTKSGLTVCEGGEWQNSALICDKFLEHFNWKSELSICDTICDIFNYLKECD